MTENIPENISPAERTAYNILRLASELRRQIITEASSRNVSPADMMSAMVTAAFQVAIDHRVPDVSEREIVTRFVEVIQAYAADLSSSECPICGHIQPLEVCEHEPDGARKHL